MGNELSDAADSVKEAVFSMRMQMYERIQSLHFTFGNLKSCFYHFTIRIKAGRLKENTKKLQVSPQPYCLLVFSVFFVFLVGNLLQNDGCTVFLSFKLVFFR